jgi:hypothetical protein
MLSEGDTIENCFSDYFIYYFFVILLLTDKVLKILPPGTGGYVYVVEHLITHEKMVLKSSYVDESKREKFEKVTLAWKTASNLSEYIVKFKDFFYKGPTACLMLFICLFICLLLLSHSDGVRRRWERRSSHKKKEI